MKTLLTTALITLLLTAPASAKTIKIGDNWFGSPTTQSINVKFGKKVTFKWVGDAPHNAVVKKGPQKWNSGVRSKGKKSWRPKKRGRYQLICTIHAGMDFKLRVK